MNDISATVHSAVLNTIRVVSPVNGGTQDSISRDGRSLIHPSLTSLPLMHKLMLLLSSLSAWFFLLLFALLFTESVDAPPLVLVWQFLSFFAPHSFALINSFPRTARPGDGWRRRLCAWLKKTDDCNDDAVRCFLISFGSGNFLSRRHLHPLPPPPAESFTLVLLGT